MRLFRKIGKSRRLEAAPSISPSSDEYEPLKVPPTNVYWPYLSIRDTRLRSNWPASFTDRDQLFKSSLPTHTRLADLQADIYSWRYDDSIAYSDITAERTSSASGCSERFSFQQRLSIASSSSSSRILSISSTLASEAGPYSQEGTPTTLVAYDDCYCDRLLLASAYGTEPFDDSYDPPELTDLSINSGQKYQQHPCLAPEPRYSHHLSDGWNSPCSMQAALKLPDVPLTFGRDDDQALSPSGRMTISSEQLTGIDVDAFTKVPDDRVENVPGVDLIQIVPPWPYRKPPARARPSNSTYRCLKIYPAEMIVLASKS